MAWPVVSSLGDYWSSYFRYIHRLIVINDWTVLIMDTNEINIDASNVRVTEVYNPSVISVTDTPGPSRFRYRWEEGELHSLLINKKSETLVVSFHDAVDRKKSKLPRFEGLESLINEDSSSMYFSDPTLYLSDTLTVSWFTGWRTVDMQRLIAGWIMQVVCQLNIKNVVLCGTSSGGFAAMQISSFIPNSVALAFNADSSISNQRDNAKAVHLANNYVQSVRPELFSNMETDRQARHIFSSKEYFDDRVSVFDRYLHKMNNYALIVSNEEDTRHEHHHLPLMEMLKDNQEPGRYRSYTYSDNNNLTFFASECSSRYLAEAVAWSEQLPPVPRSVGHCAGQLSWFDLMSQRIMGDDASYDLRLNDKEYFAKFLAENSIPAARTLALIDASAEKIIIPSYSDLVIKPTNSSSSKGVLILERSDTASFMELRTKKSMDQSDIQNYYDEYFSANPNEDTRLIIQQKILDRGQFPIPRDYKFYVFAGTVGLVQCIDRNRKPTGVAWYDGGFNKLSKGLLSINSKYQTKVGFVKPALAQEMIDLAERVAIKVGTPFVRVDLYHTPSGPVCGEVTFTPGGPYFELTDRFSTQMQMDMGAAWQLNAHLVPNVVK
ncbi:MAG: ATP-grasp fold amidoligase family protein [Glutamicibacter ardleyensis]